MKPMHHTITKLSRCPCCQSSYSKKNAGTAKHGKTAARQKAKKELRLAV